MDLHGVMVVLLVVSFQTAVLGTLPEYVPVCRTNSTDLNQCVLNATVNLMPYLAQGIPELNVPPLEPLVVPMVKLDQATQHVNFKVNFSNLQVHGLSYYSFRDVSVDLASHLVRGSVFLPRVTLQADYNIEGRILLMPIKGQGLFTANFTKTVADFNMKSRSRDVNGTQHLESSDTMIKLRVGRVKFNLDNLFDGQDIGKTTNNFVRANSKKIFEEIQPAVESVTAMLADDISNKLYRSVPENELFPSN